jgi:hypothetical protein
VSCLLMIFGTKPTIPHVAGGSRFGLLQKKGAAAPAG